MPCGDANCRLRESELLTSGPPQIARPYEFPSSVVAEDGMAVPFAGLGTSTNLFSLLTSNNDLTPISHPAITRVRSWDLVCYLTVDRRKV